MSDQQQKGPGVGFEYPAIEVAWGKRDLLLFANSIGCTVDELHFLYVSSPHVIATFVIAKTVSGTAPAICRLPNLPFDSAL